MEYQKKGLTLLKLMTENKPQTQEIQRALSRINTKNTTHRHIIIKLLKTKTKKKLQKRTGGKIPPCLDWKNDKNYSRLLIREHKSWK